MNLLSLLATIAITITTLEGICILRRDIKSSSNRLFFLISLCIFIWLLGGVFGYSSAEKENALFWLKLSCPGFIFMHSFVLHFCLKYTKITRSKFIYSIYIPSFFFLYIAITDKLVFTDIYKSGEYWVLLPNYSSKLFLIFMINYLSYYLVSLFLLYKFNKKTKSIRLKKQSKIIFLGILVTITSYNIEPFLAPLIFDYKSYGQAPIYSVLWMSFLWYAMTKYHFLEVYEEFLTFDFLDSMKTMILIINNNHKVIKANTAMQEKLSLGNRLPSLEEVFCEYELLQRIIEKNHIDQPKDLTLNIKVGNSTEFVKTRLTEFKDHYGDRVGLIIKMQEAPDIYSLLKQSGITGREYQIIQLIVSGNSNKQISNELKISLRTVETHVTNIFNKLALENRSELINYCTTVS